MFRLNLLFILPICWCFPQILLHTAPLATTYVINPWIHSFSHSFYCCYGTSVHKFICKNSKLYEIDSQQHHTSVFVIYRNGIHLLDGNTKLEVTCKGLFITVSYYRYTWWEATNLPTNMHIGGTESSEVFFPLLLHSGHNPLCASIKQSG